MISCAPCVFFFFFLFLVLIPQEGAKLYSDLKCFHNNSVHCIRDTFTITDCVISASAADFFHAAKLCVGACAAYTASLCE